MNNVDLIIYLTIALCSIVGYFTYLKMINYNPSYSQVVKVLIGSVLPGFNIVILFFIVCFMIAVIFQMPWAHKKFFKTKEQPVKTTYQNRPVQEP